MMIVASGIIDEIFEVYLDCYEDDSCIDYVVAQKNRKKIKIIVDSIYEQSVENITGQKPRNHLDARFRINKFIKNNETKYIDFLMSLDEVLSYYDTLSDKRYIDHSKDMESLFEGPLNRLCNQLFAWEPYANMASARGLRILLGRLQ